MLHWACSLVLLRAHMPFNIDIDIDFDFDFFKFDIDVDKLFSFFRAKL